MKRVIQTSIVLLMISAKLLSAQTVTFGALENANTWIGTQTFNQAIIGTGSGNDFLKFTGEGSNPACAAGEYKIWVNTADLKIKKCQNGSVSDLDTGGAGGGYDTVDGDTGSMSKSGVEHLDILGTSSELACAALDGVDDSITCALDSTVAQTDVSKNWTTDQNFYTNNAIRFADQFAGANAGAKIAAAIVDLPSTGGTVDARGLEGAQAISADMFAGTTKPVTILLGGGTYSVSATQIITVGSRIIGISGATGTIMDWTGSISGIMFQTALGATGTALKDLWLNTNVGGTSTAIKVVAGVDTVLDGLTITGTAPNGFGTAIAVTGNGSSTYANGTRITNSRILNFTVAGLNLDHNQVTILENVLLFTEADNTTAYGMIMDTGTEGLTAQFIVEGGGLNGLLVRHTNQGGVYGSAPAANYFDQAQFDTTTGGDAILFDSTLGTSTLSTRFTNSWAAAAGRNNAGTVITAAANGIAINGGKGIEFSGRIRVNANNGVYINDADVSDISLNDCLISANNQNNNADGHGVYVNTASTNISISGCHIGNILESGGNQKYGVKVSAVAADELSVIGNDLNSNTTGALSNGNTGDSWVAGNLPTSLANTLHGDMVLTDGIFDSRRTLVTDRSFQAMVAGDVEARLVMRPDSIQAGPGTGAQDLDWYRDAPGGIVTWRTSDNIMVDGRLTGSLESVGFSATPTFDASLGNSFKITLTGNVTSSTLSNPQAGQFIAFHICQDGTGGWTFVWPTNVLYAGTISGTLSTCSEQQFYYDGTNAYALGPLKNSVNVGVNPITCSGSDKLSAISAAGVPSCTADVSGGTPAWETLVNSADTATTYTANNTAETVTFDFQSNYAAAQFIIKQSTGNPTAGTLLSVQSGDGDPSLAVFDQTNDATATVFIDSGSAAAQISRLGFQDRGTLEWEAGKDASNAFIISESGIGTRITLTAGGDNTYRTGTNSANIHTFQGLDGSAGFIFAARYSSAAADPGDTGVVNVGNNEIGMAWELASPGVDRSIKVDATDLYVFAGLDCSAGDQYLTANASGQLICGTDNSGGTPAWETLTNSADTATAYNSNNVLELVDFNFTAAYGATDVAFQVTQATGNPVAGSILVDFRAADTDIVVLRAGDGTNGIKVSQAGALTAEGTGAITATLGDSATSFFASGTLEDGLINGANEADEISLANLSSRACADLSDESALCSSADIDSVTGQANWGTAATKETNDLVFNGVEADFEAGAAEGYVRLAQDTTQPAADCNEAGEEGRLRWDTDATSGQQLYGCDGTLGWFLVGDGGGGGGDSIEVEDGDDGGTFTAITTTGRFEDSGDINFVNTTNDISGLIRAAAVSADELDETGVEAGLEAVLDHDQLQGVSADQHVAHSGVTLTAGAGLSGGGDITASRTVDVGAGIGIAAAADAVAFDFTDAGTDPVLGAGGARFSNEGASAAGLVFEGDTDDAFETRLRITDPTAERIVTIPNADSTTVQPDAGAANNFLTAVSAAGVISKAQPSSSNLSDSTNVALYNNGSKTWGAGSGFNWTFDAGATDPVLEFTSGNVKVSGATTFTFEGGATDPVLTPGNSELNLSTGTLKEGGTAVSLPARSETLTNKILNVESSGNDITTVSYIKFAPAICVAGTAYLNTNDDASGGTEPTAACNDTGAIQRPSADFSGSAQNNVDLEEFPLPTGWTGNLDVTIRYVSVAASPTGNVEWEVSTVCRAIAESWDASYNAAQTITDAVGSQNQANDATQANITNTGCAANEDLMLRIGRDGVNDTNNDTAKLLYVLLTYRRTQ